MLELKEISTIQKKANTLYRKNKDDSRPSQISGRWNAIDSREQNHETFILEESPGKINGKGPFRKLIPWDTFHYVQPSRHSEADITMVLGVLATIQIIN